MSVKMNKIYCGDGFPNLPDFEAMESGGGGAGAGLIAYEQKTLKADHAYTSGDNFIYAGTIYVATANIAKDADIVLEGAGANAEALDPVQEQINDIEASMPVKWDFSTTEVDTGVKWNDGKNIFCKKIPITTPASLTYSKLVEDMDGVAEIICFFGCIDDNTYKYPLNMRFSADSFVATCVDGTGFGMTVSSSLVSKSGFIVAFYTKTA